MNVEAYNKEQMALVKKLINNTPFIYYILDREWRFQLSEGQGLRNLGFEPGQLIGVSAKDMYGEYTDVIETITKVFKGESIISLTHVNGVSYDTYYYPFFDEDGTVESLTCISLDVTQRVKAQEELKELNTTLEQRVDERTLELKTSNEEFYALNEELTAMNEEMQSINLQLMDNNNQMKSMQSQLVESEKMAALGNLVAGVAHEVNTPLGVSITAATHLTEMANNIKAMQAKGEDTKEEFEYFYEDLLMATNIIEKNLTRAGALIQSFKQLSIDQTNEEIRVFNVKEYMDEVLLSLSPSYKKADVELIVECNKSIVLEGWPGAFAQILTNLLFNALQHGFDNHEHGIIHIEVKEVEDQIEIIFSDNGKGIEDVKLKKIFEPFFTTKRHEGGTGLGLSVVFSLVTQRYSGSIKCESTIGEGTRFIINLPKSV